MGASVAAAAMALALSSMEGCSCDRTDDGPCGSNVVDADQDGAFNCAPGCFDCMGGFEDCDDSDPARSGLMPESCGDGVDNDCDQLTDDQDPACMPDAGADAASDSGAATDSGAMGTDAVPGTDATSTATTCGPGGPSCDPATEVCVRSSAGPGFSYTCMAVPAGCTSDHSCGCVAPTLCPPPTYACTDSASDNTIECDCLPCA